MFCDAIPDIIAYICIWAHSFLLSLNHNDRKGIIERQRMCHRGHDTKKEGEALSHLQDTSLNLHGRK